MGRKTDYQHQAKKLKEDKEKKLELSKERKKRRKLLGSGMKNFPSRFADPQDLVDAIESYFNECDEERKSYSMAGLCLFLGISKDTLKNNSFNPKFTPIIEAAKLVMEEDVEQKMLKGGSTTSGYMFKLKAQFDWTDRQKVDHSYGTANIFLMNDDFNDPYDNPNALQAEIVSEVAGLSSSKYGVKEMHKIKRSKKDIEKDMMIEVENDLKEMEIE